VREEKCDTYDPICLSDMKSMSGLLNDVSLMDIHEYFILEEGTPSNKRKRDICLNYENFTIN